MQSNQTDSIVDSSLAEWPTLHDVCNNSKQPLLNGCSAKNNRNEQNRTVSPIDKSEGDDIAQENENSTQQRNCRGAKKKGSKLKWKPVLLETPPYKNRYHRGGRQGSETSRNGLTNSNKNESNEIPNGYESTRGNTRGRYRGKKGRGYPPNSRHQRREGTAKDNEAENSGEQAVQPSDAEYYPQEFFDPYLSGDYYTSATRRSFIKKAIRSQIEYYFSEENLVKDVFVRRNMDTQGYVLLELVATFRRVQNMSADLDTIVEAVSESDKLEVLDGVKVRPVIDPLRWPLLEEDLTSDEALLLNPLEYPLLEQDVWCDESHIMVSPLEWPAVEHDLRSHTLRPDVPDFVPGQPYMCTVINDLQNMHFYSQDDDQHMSNGITNSADNHFDGMIQNTPVEAAS
ncbi:La-related protein, partial [Stegodyphus mimosarum]